MESILNILICIGALAVGWVLIVIIYILSVYAFSLSGVIFIAIFKNWKYTLAVLLGWIAYFKLTNSYDIHNTLLIVSNIILTVLLLLISVFTKTKDDESDEFFSIEVRSKFRKHFFYPIWGMAIMSSTTMFGCYFYEIQRYDLNRKLQAYMFDIAYSSFAS